MQFPHPSFKEEIVDEKGRATQGWLRYFIAIYDALSAIRPIGKLKFKTPDGSKDYTLEISNTGQLTVRDSAGRVIEQEGWF